MSELIFLMVPSQTSLRRVLVRRVLRTKADRACGSGISLGEEFFGVLGGGASWHNKYDLGADR